MTGPPVPHAEGRHWRSDAASKSEPPKPLIAMEERGRPHPSKPCCPVAVSPIRIAGRGAPAKAVFNRADLCSTLPGRRANQPIHAIHPPMISFLPHRQHTPPLPKSETRRSRTTAAHRREMELAVPALPGLGEKQRGPAAPCANGWMDGLDRWIRVVGAGRTVSRPLRCASPLPFRVRQDKSVGMYAVSMGRAAGIPSRPCLLVTS